MNQNNLGNFKKLLLAALVLATLASCNHTPDWNLPRLISCDDAPDNICATGGTVVTPSGAFQVKLLPQNTHLAYQLELKPEPCPGATRAIPDTSHSVQFRLRTRIEPQMSPINIRIEHQVAWNLGENLNAIPHLKAFVLRGVATLPQEVPAERKGNQILANVTTTGFSQSEQACYWLEVGEP